MGDTGEHEYQRNQEDVILDCVRVLKNKEMKTGYEVTA